MAHSLDLTWFMYYFKGPHKMCWNLESGGGKGLIHNKANIYMLIFT